MKTLLGTMLSARKTWLKLPRTLQESRNPIGKFNLLVGSSIWNAKQGEREKDLGKKGGRSEPMSFCVSNVPICLAFYQMWACLCNKNFWTRYQNPFIFIQILIKDISCWPIVSHGRRWTAGQTNCQSNSWGKFNMYTREEIWKIHMSFGNIWKYYL